MWSSIIEEIILWNSEIFYTPNEVGETPQSIDHELWFGLSRLVDEIQKKKKSVIENEAREVKEKWRIKFILNKNQKNKSLKISSKIK